MKRKLFAACVVTLLLSVVATVLVCDHVFGLFERSDSAEQAVFSKLHSQVLGEEREVIVHLPELIVVGIPNVSGKGRQRDYTPPFMLQDLEAADSPNGEADRFLSFLKTELLPRIESDYRALPFRMLAGHSRGGLLVCYSLLAEPELFQARFAHSPALWRDDAIMNTKLTEFLTTNKTLDTFFYLSLGSAENEKRRAAYQRACAILEQTRNEGLRWHSAVVAGADHNSNPEKATPLGFKALYKIILIVVPSPTRVSLSKSFP